MDYTPYFSKNALRMKRSEIRELLKLVNQPDMISFAGGLPAPDVFPVEELREIVDEVLREEGRKALQYSPTEGDPRLKEELIKLMAKEGISAKPENILIVTASQQGLDLLGKVFIDRKDTVIMESPTYVGAIQAFNSYSANMETVECDEEGIIPEALEDKLKFLFEKGIKPKFIYLIPDFQNPSGVTLSGERRVQILEIAEKYKMIVVEDTPYRQLRFEGKPEPPLKSLDKNGRVISLFTFSKIFLPGFRLGWIVAPEKIIEKLVMAKQSADLCTSAFVQAITYRYLKRGLLDTQIKKIVKEYREKRDLMLSMFEKYMPKLDGLKWTRPKGGLFLWVTLPTYMNSRELFVRAVEKKVAFVVGSAFHPHEKCENSFRVNFSYSSHKEIEEGAKRLARAIEEYEEEIKRKEFTVITP